MSTTIIQKIEAEAPDFRAIKSMRLQEAARSGYTIIIKLKSSTKNVWNPQSHLLEKQTINHIIHIEYADYSTAVNYFMEWVEYRWSMQNSELTA